MPTEIIPSQNLSELPDEKTPSAMPPVYTGGENFFFENCNSGMMWILFWRAYPSVIPSAFPSVFVFLLPTEMTTEL
jgi:hypothetical protein